MKKILFAATVALMASFAACSNPSKVPASENQSTPAVSPKTSTVDTVETLLVTPSEIGVSQLERAETGECSPTFSFFIYFKGVIQDSATVADFSDKLHFEINNCSKSVEFVETLYGKIKKEKPANIRITFHKTPSRLIITKVVVVDQWESKGSEKVANVKNGYLIYPQAE